jgi:hypothetical protein
MEGQILASNNIPRREIITLLRSQLINLIGYEFPEALEALFLICSLFKIVGLSIQRARNASLILGMLKINNIMRLYLLFKNILIHRTMLDKFPQAFTLIFVNN